MCNVLEVVKKMMVGGEMITLMKGMWKKILKLISLLTIPLFLTGCFTVPLARTEPATQKTVAEDSTFSIRFLDMGQADATLVECDGHYMLIDGGNKEDSSKIYTILEDSGIDHLDIVVGTHADEDHIGGLAGALNYADADLILCPTQTHDTKAFKDFVKYADQNGGILVPEVGDEYDLGSSTISILGVNGGKELNDTSIILKIVYGDTSFLFTGDAEGEAEQAVIDGGMDLSATVLKVGHHGSSDSTTDAFLQKVMPAFAIISVGAGNTYLHPSDVVLKKLENINAEVFRTDLQGDIMLTSNGKTVSITTEKTVQSQPSQQNDALSKDSGSAGVTVPNGTDYVLNTNTMKFHYPSCRSAKQMKAKNAVYYSGTRDEVIAMGYDPCGNCQP